MACACARVCLRPPAAAQFLQREGLAGRLIARRAARAGAIPGGGDGKDSKATNRVVGAGEIGRVAFPPANRTDMWRRTEVRSSEEMTWRVRIALPSRLGSHCRMEVTVACALRTELYPYLEKVADEMPKWAGKLLVFAAGGPRGPQNPPSPHPLVRRARAVCPGSGRRAATSRAGVRVALVAPPCVGCAAHARALY